MRLAPVPMFFGNDLSKAVYFSGQSSRTTHGSLLAIDACRYLGALIACALGGEDKDILLGDRLAAAIWADSLLEPEIDEIAKGSFKSRQPSEIKGNGYVVKSLEAAL